MKEKTTQENYGTANDVGVKVDFTDGNNEDEEEEDYLYEKDPFDEHGKSTAKGLGLLFEIMFGVVFGGAIAGLLAIVSAICLIVSFSVERGGDDDQSSDCYAVKYSLLGFSISTSLTVISTIINIKSMSKLAKDITIITLPVGYVAGFVSTISMIISLVFEFHKCNDNLITGSSIFSIVAFWLLAMGLTYLWNTRIKNAHQYSSDDSDY